MPDPSVGQSGGSPEVGAGLPKPRDEAAIKRKIYSAVTEADNLLRQLYQWDQMNVTGGDGDTHWKAEIRRVRGLLAEWRLESD